MMLQCDSVTGVTSVILHTQHRPAKGVVARHGWVVPDHHLGLPGCLDVARAGLAQATLGPASTSQYQAPEVAHLVCSTARCVFGVGLIADISVATVSQASDPG